MISHNHYDHFDRNTFAELYKRFASRPPAVFIGMNGRAAVRDVVTKDTTVVDLDWWEDREIEVPGRGRARITASASCGT